MTTTPSHHSVVHQNCLRNGQVIGMSRGFHGRKFTKRRGIIVTHLTLGLRGRLLECKRETFLGFYTIKTLFLQCKTPNRISKLATQLGSSQVARVRGRRLGLAKPSPPPLSRSPCSPLFARPTPLTVSLIQNGGISFRIITRSNPILLHYFGGKELQTGFWYDTDTIHGKLCILLFTSSRFVSFSQISNSIIQAWSRHLADT